MECGQYGLQPTRTRTRVFVDPECFRPPCSMFPGLHGDSQSAGVWLRAALRIWHLHPALWKWLPGAVILLMLYFSTSWDDVHIISFPDGAARRLAPFWQLLGAPSTRVHHPSALLWQSRSRRLAEHAGKIIATNLCLTWQNSFKFANRHEVVSLSLFLGLWLCFVVLRVIIDGKLAGSQLVFEKFS